MLQRQRIVRRAVHGVLLLDKPLGLSSNDALQKAKRLQIHTVPTLHFQFDRTTERAAELSALITRANATRALDE